MYLLSLLQSNWLLSSTSGKEYHGSTNPASNFLESVATSPTNTLQTSEVVYELQFISVTHMIFELNYHCLHIMLHMFCNNLSIYTRRYESDCSLIILFFSHMLWLPCILLSACEIITYFFLFLKRVTKNIVFWYVTSITVNTCKFLNIVQNDLCWH